MKDNDGEKYREYIERIYTIRKCELDHFMVHHVAFMVLF